MKKAVAKVPSVSADLISTLLYALEEVMRMENHTFVTFLTVMGSTFLIVEAWAVVYDVLLINVYNKTKVFVMCIYPQNRLPVSRYDSVRQDPYACT